MNYETFYKHLCDFEENVIGAAISNRRVRAPYKLPTSLSSEQLPLFYNQLGSFSRVNNLSTSKRFVRDGSVTIRLYLYQLDEKIELLNQSDAYAYASLVEQYFETYKWLDLNGSNYVGLAEATRLTSSQPLVQGLRYPFGQGQAPAFWGCEFTLSVRLYIECLL